MVAVAATMNTLIIKFKSVLAISTLNMAEKYGRKVDRSALKC